MNVAHNGLPSCNQASHNKRSASADIWGIHRCTNKLFNSAHDSMMPIDTHVGTKFH
jgi:ribosomal protein L37AE/L43A